MPPYRIVAYSVLTRIMIFSRVDTKTFHLRTVLLHPNFHVIPTLVITLDSEPYRCPLVVGMALKEFLVFSWRRGGGLLTCICT